MLGMGTLVAYRRSMRATLLLASGLLFLVSGSTAQAQAPYEPNDFRNQAKPLMGGETVNGGIETTNDVDYFSLAVRDQVQTDITVAATGPGSRCRINVTLQTKDGYFLADESVENGEVPEHIFFSLGRGLYFLEVEDGSSAYGDCLRADNTYSLQLNPVGGFTTADCAFAAGLADMRERQLQRAKEKYRAAEGQKKRKRSRAKRKTAQAAFNEAVSQRQAACGS